MAKKTTYKGFNLFDDDLAILMDLCKELGVNQTAVIRMALRQFSVKRSDVMTTVAAMSTDKYTRSLPNGGAAVVRDGSEGVGW